MDDSGNGSGVGRLAGEGKEEQFEAARQAQGVDRIVTFSYTPYILY